MDQEAFKRNSPWFGIYAWLVAFPGHVNYRLLYNDQNSHISRAANARSRSNPSLIFSPIFSPYPRLVRAYVVSHWRLFTCESYSKVEAQKNTTYIQHLPKNTTIRNTY